MYYAGIGSRKTPSYMLTFMSIVSVILNQKGYVLRSGGANGADSAFEMGAGDQKEIFLPHAGFNNSVSDLDVQSFDNLADIKEIASYMHPKWSSLSQQVKDFHTRNVCQVLGQNLETPVDFVVCWTPDGAETASETNIETGGTGSAIRIASKMEIPVFNLARHESFCNLVHIIEIENIYTALNDLSDLIDKQHMSDILDLIDACGE